LVEEEEEEELVSLQETPYQEHGCTNVSLY
jgi:hypothetical protein